MHPLNLHLIAGTAALVAAVAIWGLTLNRIVRRKLRLSIFLFGIYAAAHLVFALRPAFMPRIDTDFYSFERLAFAAALINLLVVSLINPLRADRVPDRFPSIVQDAIVIGMLMLIATFAFGEKFLATSAVSAVVLGFALQDTFGNAIAGLAIQSEKPFNIGHWVRVGDFEGRVAEVSWRATRLRTKTGNFIVLPNNIVSKEAIINYSEPVCADENHSAGRCRLRCASEPRQGRHPGGDRELSARAGRASGAGRAGQVSTPRRSTTTSSSGSTTSKSTTRHATRCTARSTTRSAAATSRSRTRPRWRCRGTCLRRTSRRSRSSARV